MIKFHINNKGIPVSCKAEPGDCPYGGENEHFDNIEEAQIAADELASNEFGILGFKFDYSDTETRLEKLIDELGEEKVLKELVPLLADITLEETIDHISTTYNLEIDIHLSKKQQFEEISDIINTEQTLEEIYRFVSPEEIHECIVSIEKNYRLSEVNKDNWEENWEDLETDEELMEGF